MHWEAYSFVETCKSIFPRNFCHSSVLEVGSEVVNYSIRSLFEKCDYTGIDLAKGRGVDVVVSGHEYRGNLFDTVLSCECFEHNPVYAETLQNMLVHLKEDGLLIVSCATPNRPEHGTFRTDPSISPGSSSIGWDYYKNLTSEELEPVLKQSKEISYFFLTNPISFDLYLVCVKSASEKMHRLLKNCESKVQGLISSHQNINKLLNQIDEAECTTSLQNQLSIFLENETSIHPLFLNKMTRVLNKLISTNVLEILETKFSKSNDEYSDQLSNYNLACYYAVKNNFDIAMHHLYIAHNQSRKSPDVTRKVIEIITLQRDKEALISFIDKENLLESTDLQLLDKLTESLLSFKEYKLAELYALQSFLLGARAPKSYLMFVQCLIENQKFTNAKALLRDAHKTYGHLPWIFLMFSKISEQFGDIDSALKIANLGLSHNPNNNQLLQAAKRLSVS